MTLLRSDMTLLRSELGLRRGSLLSWAIGVLLLVGMIVAFYPAVRDDESLNSLYASLSPSLQALLGGADLTSPTGFLNTQMFAFFLPAVLLVYGLGRGAASIAGEEEERTLDLLLAQPLPRSWAYAQKAAAVAVVLTGFATITWVILVASNSVVRFDLPVANLSAMCLQMLGFCLALALAAQAIAAAVGRRSVGIAAVGAYTFVSYLVYGLAPTITWLQHLRPLSLWRWYLLNDPLATGFGWWELAVLAAVCLVALLAGILAFDRRDLRA